MRIGALGFGLIVVLSLAATVPASAEFFNCNQRPGQVLYSYSGSPSQYGGSRTSSSSRRYTSDYSAQSSRQRYQAHATYFGSRHYGNDRPRW